ncbi:TetR/AcrR family transcriptional regulator [Loktanella sp. SALINAS62]|uniref:TetR/AcrR family transcriptional regulator n=1 Tax=Loktanella sp. SALINAS62 TaxID=2706124 RepID=UPI001B8D5AD5|nr:TetR/AcrR family transcriptional regulator [Loktanella sp. SALINAS62]MBS1303679.1 TetR/AcrR family transcriptional regulator [Loktanella sp. SALINAS62]
MTERTADKGATTAQGWKQDPEGVRRDILSVAVSEFAARGLSGARIDDIAARTRTSKRMIYYYFGDKDGLYARALEAAYAKVRHGEENLDLAGFEPDDALARLIGFTFDHHRANPDFIRMVMIENIHNADCIAHSDVIRTLNVAAIDTLSDICKRGVATGVFRAGVNPMQLHWQISALSFFNVSNRPSFSALFGADLFTDAQQNALRDDIIRMVVESVRMTKETLP